jgi:MtN3 and saliva related transmembrane protein
MSGIQTVPQLHKTYTTKSVKDLSLVFILLVLFADFLWLVHGHYITDNSLIIAGAFGLFVNGILLFLFFRYSKKKYFWV